MTDEVSIKMVFDLAKGEDLTVRISKDEDGIVTIFNDGEELMHIRMNTEGD